MWSEAVARCLGCAGITAKDTVQVSYGYGLFTGGLGVHDGATKMGCTVVPTSAGNTKRQLMLMNDLGTNAVCCTPSYALMMGEYIRDNGVDKSNWPLRVGIFGAEPWTEGMRTEIEALLGVKALDIYGLTETVGPGVAMECIEGQYGLHMWEDFFIPEIVDPETGDPLPDGELGELVITTICKEGMPTVRFRTHDLTRIIPGECPCGSKFPRIDVILGRTDDMVKVKGVNIFPSQIDEMIKDIEGASSEYQIMIDHLDGRDILTLFIEIEDGANAYALEHIIGDAFKAKIGIAANIKPVAMGELPRSEKKSTRVFDNRY